jgi:hypothetical protein
MASTINGTSTGNGGLISTGDDSGILNIQTNETTAITVDASQNVACTGRVSGTSYTATSLNLSSNGGLYLNYSTNNVASRSWQIANDVSAFGDLQIRQSTTQTGTTYSAIATFDASGNFLVKKTASSSSADNNVGAQLAATGKCIFEASGDRALILNRLSDNGIIQEFFRGAGNQVGNIQANTSSVAYNTSSDYRLKEDIAPMTGALAKVTQLKPVTYKWKSDGEEGQGFIAHELQAIVPDCVTGAKDAVDADGNPQYQGIDTSFLVATLTAAIQELKAINDTQAETINALTARIVALETA